MTTRSDEGLVEEVDEPLLARLDDIEVRESTRAGAYFCAHVLFVSTRWARADGSSIGKDRDGDPLVGFIHVPADAESGHVVMPDDGGGPRAPRSKRERHAATVRVLACALRGVADELAEAGVAAPRRLLVSGFGPFGAVKSNPTGDLVDDDECMAEASTLAFGTPPTALGALADGRVLAHAVGGVVIGHTRLEVDDACLDPSRVGAIPWAMEQFRPHALVALGVHRATSNYRVEIAPNTAGLSVVAGRAPTHERGREADVRDPQNRALSRAILRGARALGFID